MPFNAFALVKKRTHLEHIALRKAFREYVEAHPGCTRKDALASLGCSACLLQRVTAPGVAGVKQQRTQRMVKGKLTYVTTYWSEVTR